MAAFTIDITADFNLALAKAHIKAAISALNNADVTAQHDDAASEVSILSSELDLIASRLALQAAKATEGAPFFR